MSWAEAFLILGLSFIGLTALFGATMIVLFMREEKKKEL